MKNEKFKEVMGMFSAVTGLTLDDVVAEVTALTPEDEMEAKLDNIKKMMKHHGVVYPESATPIMGFNCGTK